MDKRSTEARLLRLEASDMASRAALTALIVTVYKNDPATLRHVRKTTVEAIERLYADVRFTDEGHEILQRAIQTIEELFDPFAGRGDAAVPRADHP